MPGIPVQSPFEPRTVAGLKEGVDAALNAAEQLRLLSIERRSRFWAASMSWKAPRSVPMLKVSRSLRLEDVAGERLLHPLQISFCIVRKLHRRQPFSRSTDQAFA